MRNVANLKHCSPEKINAIEPALKYKGDLTVLGFAGKVKLKKSLFVDALWAIYEVAKIPGIGKALENSDSGKLAMWQVTACVPDQGSRLSAVGSARRHAACDVPGTGRGFSENDLYENPG